MKFTEVAVGVILNDRGEVLLGSRPEGKPYAGFWEFPGGKLEKGESVEQALKRELKEELDIEIVSSRPWFQMTHVYPHAAVRLHFQVCSLSLKQKIVAKENQEFGFFFKSADLPGPLLPADEKILNWLRLPNELTDEKMRLLELKGKTIKEMDEMKPALEAGFDFVMANETLAEKILNFGEPYLPLFVETKSNARLSDWQRRGAHGIVLK